jgi:PAS domain S-box-containing protein
VAEVNSEAIIRNIEDGIILVDAEFKVTGINPMAEKILQIKAEKAQNTHFLEVVKNEQLFHYVKESIESGKPPQIEERQNVFTVEQNGKRYHYQFSVTPIHRGSGVVGDASVQDVRLRT